MASWRPALNLFLLRDTEAFNRAELGLGGEASLGGGGFRIVRLASASLCAFGVPALGASWLGFSLTTVRPPAPLLGK